MRLINTIAIPAVVAAIALLGAPSAMAESTVLCSNNEGGAQTCAAGNQVGTVHYVGTVQALTSLGNVACTALFSGTAGVLASPLDLHGNFSYSGCTTGCILREGSGSALLKLLKTNATEGTLTGENFVLEIECTLSINCSYSFGTASGRVTSANLPTTAGQMLMTEQALTKTIGFLCPSTAKLDMSLTSLTDVYVKK
jgi:hypothetical protein